MCKSDLKDAYFSIPLYKESQEYVQFQWEGNLYQFQCLCFGLVPAPPVFTKLLKVPMAVLRRLSILIIIYLDDMLIIGRNVEEVEMARDTSIYYHLSIAKSRISIQPKKISALPLSGNRILGSNCQFDDNDIVFANRKTRKSSTKMQGNVQHKNNIDFRIDKTSTIQAVLPACLQLRNLQQLQIQALKLKKSFQSSVTLTPLAKEELAW